MARWNQPVDHMFRAGQLSLHAMKRLSAQHGWSPGKGAKTKGAMAPFHGKGAKDQGGVRDRGFLNTNHINQARHQTMGSPARGAGAPSRGGGAGSQGRPQLDGPELFPDGDRTSGTGGPSPRLRAQAGRIPPMGGYYGGGGQDTQ
jgi:hypothetical protein